jgi:hypothetical protein
LNRAKILIITPLLIFSSLLGVPYVHAVTGQAVCINTSTATDCATSASFVGTAFTVGSQLVVNVNVQSSPSINGFDVQVLTDPTLLRAASVSIGSVIPGPPIGNVLVECLDGVLVVGQTCTNTDGLGVTHLGLVESGVSTMAPTTGTLFSIRYNIVGAGGPATIGFQSGCSGTTSSPNMCVTLLAGLNNPPIVTLVTAPFANGNEFSLDIHTVSTATSTAFSDTATSITPGSTGTSTLNLKAIGLFSDTVNLVTTPSAGLTASTAMSSFALSNGGAASTTLSYSSNTPASYTVTVTGTAAVGGQKHSVTLSVLVSQPDFSISANPNALTVAPGSSGTSTITVGSISGFSGTVGLSSSVTGITASLSANSIPNSAGTSTLTVQTTSSTVPGTYTVTVTGLSGSLTHSAQVVVTVPPPDFDLNPVPNSLDAPVGVAISSVVNIDSLFNFAGTVTLTATVAGAGTVGTPTPLTATLAPNSVVLTPGSTLTSTITVGNTPTTTLGNYTITIKGVSGSLSHTATIFFVLEDFSISISKTSFLTYPGAACTPVCSVGHRETAFLTAGALGGFLGFGAASQGNSPVGPNCIRFIVSFVAQTPQCIDFEVFFANGTQATKAQVLSGLVPFITLPRFLFPIPDNSPLCFSFGLNDTNTHCDGTDTGFVRVRSFPFTLPGTYFFNVHAGFSILTHDACGGSLPQCTIVVPAPPELVQLQFKPHLSLSKNGNAQVFRIGIFNPNAATTLSVIIRVNGIASDKTTTFNLVSLVQTLTPGQTINNILLTLPLSTTTIGLTFTITVTLQWGVPPFTLTARSHPDISGFPNSGSFTVFP